MFRSLTRKLSSLVFVVLLSGLSFGQFVSGTARRVLSGTATPDTCNATPADIFVVTTGPTLYVCGPANTWSAIGGGAPSSSAITYGGLYCKASSNGAGPATCNSTYNVVANKIIIATCTSAVGGAGSDTMTMADTGPGGGSALTWTQIATAFNATNTERATIWWANPGAGTGADTFNCTDSLGGGAISFWGMSVHEIVGATVASPIDTSVTKTGA